MKKTLAAISIALSLFAFMACSDDSSDTEYVYVEKENKTDLSDVLDFRVTTSAEDKDSQASSRGLAEEQKEVLETKYVKIENAEGGVKFTIKRPEEEKFKNGVDYVGIIRVENGTWTTKATVESWRLNDGEKEATVLYPLCEPGEFYEFMVEFTPKNKESINDEIFETVRIKATDGIGDINYRNLDKINEHVKAIYNEDGTVDFQLLKILPPNVIPATPIIEIHAGETGDKDTFWNKGKWVAGSVNRPIVRNYNEARDFTWKVIPTNWLGDLEDLSENPTVKDIVKAAGKKYFKLQQYFAFYMPYYEGFSEFRTATVDSEIIAVE